MPDSTASPAETQPSPTAAEGFSVSAGRILCSTPGCEVVVGARGYGAKRPRPCSRCAGKADRARRNAAARDRWADERDGR